MLFVGSLLLVFCPLQRVGLTKVDPIPHIIEIEGKRKGGSTACLAQIDIKRNGRKLHSQAHIFDAQSRNCVEIMFGHLKDWRRAAIRYDRYPKIFLPAIVLVATVIYWL